MESLHTGNVDERSAFRGLLWLAFGNLVCAAMLVGVSVLIRKIDSVRDGVIPDLVVRNIQTVRFATVFAQTLAWAIVSALVSRRRYVGIGCLAALAVLMGTINWLGVVIEMPAAADSVAPYVSGSFLALSMFAIAQGLRFFLGWRLVLHEVQPAQAAGRFGTADLIEWTISIAFFFGLGHLGGWFHNLSLLARSIAWWALATLPVVLSVMSRRGPSGVCFLAAMSIAIFATGTFEYCNGYFDSRGALLRRSVEHSLVLGASYVAATAANFFVMRSLGFRWTTRRRHVSNSS